MYYAFLKQVLYQEKNGCIGKKATLPLYYGFPFSGLPPVYIMVNISIAVNEHLTHTGSCPRKQIFHSLEKLETIPEKVKIVDLPAIPHHTSLMRNEIFTWEDN